MATRDQVLIISQDQNIPQNLNQALTKLNIDWQHCPCDPEKIRTIDHQGHSAAVLSLEESEPLSADETQALLEEVQCLTLNTLILSREVEQTRRGQAPARNRRIVNAHCDESPEMLEGRLATLIEIMPLIRRLEDEIERVQCLQAPLNDQFMQVDEEMRVAARLQKDFLPRSLPKIDSIEFATIWRPAGWVSGDIYDIMRLDEKHIGFYIADAVGHGVPAALLTIFIKRALETKRIEGHNYELVDPGAALSKLNEDIVAQELSSFQFVTACYGILHTETLHLRIASAGHPMPMRIPKNGRANELDVSGPLLGVFSDQHYQTREFNLDWGDKLLLYTDGVEAAFVNNGPNEPLRFRQEFGDLAEYDIATMCEKLVEVIDREEGSLHPRDDVTILGIEFGNCPDSAAN